MSAQLLAWYLFGHYLNQCWLVVNWVRRANLSEIWIKTRRLSVANKIWNCRLLNFRHFVLGILYSYSVANAEIKSHTDNIFHGLILPRSILPPEHRVATGSNLPDTEFINTCPNPCHTGILIDGVIKWKPFPRYWPFVRISLVTGEFRPQRPVARNFDVFFDLRLNKRLRKQSRHLWFETPPHSLWRHCNVKIINITCHPFFG